MNVFIRLESSHRDESREFGPFEYAQITHGALRVDDDKTFAEFSVGYWWLAADSHDKGWSDIIIFAKGQQQDS